MVNQYNMIFLNMQEFLSRTGSMEEMLALLRKLVLWDLKNAYPDVNYFDDADLVRSMQDIYAARNFYTLHREFPTGKGFADMVFLPRKKFPDKPAIVVELKWNKSAKGAISQIKERQYCKSLEEYHGNILLVGIDYDKNTRKHECIIEECEK